MSYNPTLVSASLSDDELQKSINSLVNKFKEATDKMRGYMDSAVKDIKTQLQSLGNVNINIGTTSDGGSTRRVKQEQAVAQAIKETTAAKKEQKVCRKRQEQQQKYGGPESPHSLASKAFLRKHLRVYESGELLGRALRPRQRRKQEGGTDEAYTQARICHE